MCTDVLPPGGYPIAVKYIISYRMKGVVVIGCRFESYITIAVKNNTLSVYPVIYKSSKTHSLLEPSRGLELTAKSCMREEERM
jgi:hypothetical protein